MLAEIKSVAMRLVRDEEGATVVEYAILVALIAAVVIGVVTVIGHKANNSFNAVNNDMPN